MSIRQQHKDTSNQQYWEVDTLYVAFNNGQTTDMCLYNVYKKGF